MNQAELELIGAKYPIKLEYYKTEDRYQNDNGLNQKRYGIEVIKTSYVKENVNVETAKTENIIENELVANQILQTLKENKVTPISAEYIVQDLLKELV